MAINGFYINIADATKVLKLLGRKFGDSEIKLALARAINRTLAKGKTAASSEIRKTYRIRKRDLDPKVKVFKASRAKPVGKVSTWGTPISLTNFNPSQRKRGISFNIKGKRVFIKGAFWQQKKKGGGRTIFARGRYGATGFVPSKSRYPISKLVTLSQGVMFNNPGVIDRTMAPIERDFEPRFRHELNFLLAGLIAKGPR